MNNKYLNEGRYSLLTKFLLPDMSGHLPKTMEMIEKKVIYVN